MRKEMINDQFRNECHQIIDKEQEFLLVVSTAIVEGAPCFRVSLCGGMPAHLTPELPTVIEQALFDTMKIVRKTDE